MFEIIIGTVVGVGLIVVVVLVSQESREVVLNKDHPSFQGGEKKASLDSGGESNTATLTENTTNLTNNVTPPSTITDLNPIRNSSSQLPPPDPSFFNLNNWNPISIVGAITIVVGCIYGSYYLFCKISDISEDSVDSLGDTTEVDPNMPPLPPEIETLLTDGTPPTIKTSPLQAASDAYSWLLENFLLRILYALLLLAPMFLVSAIAFLMRMQRYDRMTIPVLHMEMRYRRNAISAELAHLEGVSRNLRVLYGYQLRSRTFDAALTARQLEENRLSMERLLRRKAELERLQTEFRNLPLSTYLSDDLFHRVIQLDLSRGNRMFHLQSSLYIGTLRRMLDFLSSFRR